MNIKKQKLSASIIGLGYVGLPMLHLMAKKKVNYFGFEKNRYRLDQLKRNKTYISDISNKELRQINKDKIFDLKDIYKVAETDYIIFCLPTPLSQKKEPDMTFITEAFNIVEPYLVKNQTIILESTVYPGATRKIFEEKILKRFNLGKNFFLCYSPERINPGQLKKSGYKFFFENTTKVISGYDESSLNKIKKIYNFLFKKTYYAKSLEIAEMSKLVENSYRSVNIGLVNELKMICKNLNLNIHDVQDTASSKPFGFTRFTPGPGVGGHCIPIDPIFVDWIAKKNKISAKFISLARETNLKITNWIIQNIIKDYPKVKDLKKKLKILIIGMAYKPNVNDSRESPSLEIFKKLEKYNNSVDFFDSKIKRLIISGKKKISNDKQNFKSYDFVVLCTNHDDLNKKKLIREAKLIFDTRGVFKSSDLKKVIHL